MRISYSWLSDFLGNNLSAADIAERLSVSGLEVEHIENTDSIPGGLRGFVIGHVLTCEKHPNADKLHVTTVDIGTGEAQPIVCGAPNVAAGQKVIVALPGTEVTVPGKGTFTIGETKIRGEISRGMICADDECGLGSSHDGIRVLPADAPTGMPAAQYFKVVSDTVLEIGLTANRGDAASHLGVARDVAALYNKKIQLPTGANFTGPAAKIHIEITDADLCKRYVVLEISGIQVVPSPEWMQNRLRSIGIEPINHIVDCTNYVLHEMGQPLHAFDLHALKGNQIHVRMAKQGETLVTLDKQLRNLGENDLVIADASGPVALAGVFGGLESGVNNQTIDILLESACFHPGKVRKTARKHVLNTDASFRFERGTDVEMCLKAALRAAALIMETAGGSITGLTDVYPTPFEPLQLTLDQNKLRSFAGVDIDNATCSQILTDLGFTVTTLPNDVLQVGVPSWRNDVEQPVDLIEEIMRMYGFDQVPLKGNMQVSLGGFEGNQNRVMKSRAGKALQAHGFYEIINNSLGSENTHRPFSEQLTTLSNPLSNDMAVMRASLLPGMLQAAQYNRNRKNTAVKFYEFGRVYRTSKGAFEETEMLGLLMMGNDSSESWRKKSVRLDYYHLKEAVAVVQQSLRITVTHDGWKLQQVDPGILREYDLDGDVWYAEIAWDALKAGIKTGGFKVVEPPRFPRMRRDLSLVVDSSVPYAELEKIAVSQNIAILQEMNVFDVFEGKPLEAGKKAIAISFMLGVADRTLTDTEADAAVNALMNAFESRAGAHIRK
jgi:phenylalanyl-tRNA synthetase beta chain